MLKRWACQEPEAGKAGREAMELGLVRELEPGPLSAARGFHFAGPARLRLLQLRLQV